MESESCKNKKSLSTYMKSEHLNSKDFPSKMTPGKQMATSQILKYLPKKQDCSIGFYRYCKLCKLFNITVAYHHKLKTRILMMQTQSSHVIKHK